MNDHERRRLALIRDLTCPIMGSAPDEEIAADHGVTADTVARVRMRLRRDVVTSEIMQAAAYLASIRRRGEGAHEVIVEALHEAIKRALANQD